MQKDTVSFLVQKFIDGRLTEAEEQELAALLKTGDETSVLEIIEQLGTRESANPPAAVTSQHLQDSLQKILSVDKQYLPPAENPANADVPVIRHIHFLRRGWVKYAAAIIIMLGAGTYFWTANKRTTQTIAKGSRQLPADILPGGDKAVLTLANGKKIILDSAANGSLAQQGNTLIVKLPNGRIVYDLQGNAGNEVMLNTMSTPAGGQYQVTLPDSTRVWLNAASSITYPTAFVEKIRSVKITGEVYFEVTKNKQKPFIVDIDGKSSVEVLGTSFNINSYTNEESIKTTLLEGSVKVHQGTSTAFLKPGQQAVVASSGQPFNNGVTINSNIDMAQALAWKNGLFNFNGADIRTVMRQLERWYDIKVRYEGPVLNDVFKGKMYRNVNLSDVLDMLREMDVKFRVEGKTLVVTG